MKAGQTEIGSKLFWRNGAHRFYEFAINACFMLGNKEDAFYFFERSRAVLLNDELNEQKWMGKEDIYTQVQIKKNIQKFEDELSQVGPGNDKYAELNSEIFKAKQELAQLQQNIKFKDPLYHQFFVDSNIMTIVDVRKNLQAKDQTLLELFVGDSAVFLLTLNNEKTKLRRINYSEFVLARDKYISYLSQAELLNIDFKGFLKFSNSLYHLLFETDTIKSRLLVSPDGIYFPFESLVTNLTLPNPKYFVEDHSITYTYSARFAAMNFIEEKKQDVGDFFGMAPLNFPLDFRLNSLIGSDQSLENVAENFRSPIVLTGPRATRSAFLQEYDKFRIIHLYSHASDSSLRGEPVIYFADSSLYLSELAGESRPATRLVMLAACETAGGKLYNGEGVFSFNRGFAALGVPACITNLWEVDEKSTYELSESFYSYLASGFSTDIALQKAKIDFLRNAKGEKKLPFYWAAPILAGQAEQFNIKRKLTPGIVSLIIGLLLAAIITFIMIKRKRENPNPSQNKAGIAA
jgi:CHAT domain-containing protein